MMFKRLSFVGATVLLAIVVLCASQIPELSTQYSMRQFFPKDHPVLKINDEVQNTFDLHSTPMFFALVSLPESEHGTWIQKKNLLNLANLTTAMRDLSHVKAAHSLASLDIAVHLDDELRVGTLLETVPETEWSNTVAGLPLLKSQFLSTDERSVLIAIEPDTTDTHALTDLRNELDSVLQDKAGGLDGRLAGIPALQLRLSEKLQSEVGIFFGFSLLIFVLMFFLFYKNVSSVVFAAIGLIASNAVVLGVLAELRIAFSVLLSTLPVIVSIAFTSLAIHTLHLFADRLAETKGELTSDERWRIAFRTLKEIFLANLLGSTTTAVGFAMLATAPIPALREYAGVVAASVMLTWFVTQLLMVVSMGWIQPEQRSWMRSRAWWTVPITRRAVPIFIAVLFVCFVMTGISSQLCFSSRLFDDLPKGEDVRDAMTEIDERFGGTVALDLVIDSKEKDYWKEPRSIASLGVAVEKLRSNSEIGAVLGISDFMGAKTPETREGVAETFFLYSMSPADPMRNFVDNEFRKTRVSLRLRDVPSDQIETIRSSALATVAKEFPNAEITETGLAVNSHTINQEVAKELVFGFWQSLAVIGLLLVLVFGSMRWAFVACIPNLIPPAILAGALAIAQTPVKPSVALIFSIALGLAFNNTVYLLTRLRRFQKEKNLSFLPLRRTLLEEGNPCLSESVLMFAGFLIFLASDFQLNQTLGAYMVLSIVAGALGDLVFLPAMLKIFPRMVVQVADRSGHPIGKRAMAASIAAIVFITFGSARAGADEAKILLKQAQTSLEARSDEATVSLKIIEANGDEKVREMQLRSMRSDDSYQALVRIESPADIKGTALLAEVKNGAEEQWLYLPSTKQVRRVVSGNKSAGVLGSELSPEDLNSEALKGASAKLVKKSDKYAWIEVKPAANNSEYTKVVLVLQLDKHVPAQMDYYVGSKIKKKVFFKDYVVVNKISRARKIVVQNLLNKRSTEVVLSSIKVNGRLDSGDFTVAALKRGN